MRIKNQLLLLLVMLAFGFGTARAQQQVIVAATQNGTIAVDKTAATAGETVTITVAPDAGYQIAKSDIVVEATIDPGSANAPRFSTTGPSVGKKIELQGDEPANLQAERTYTFVMPEAPYNVLITAHFGGVINYSITISPDMVNGTVTSDKATATYQETVTLTVTPDPAYELATLQATSLVGGSITAINPTPLGYGLYTFEMPARDVTIEATFTRQAYHINISQQIEHGSISAPATAYFGDPVTVTVNPDRGYELDQLTYRFMYSDGTSSDAFFTVDNQQFFMPASDIIMSCTFKLKQYQVEVEEAIWGEHGFVMVANTGHSDNKFTMGETVSLLVSTDTGYALTHIDATYEEGTTEVNLPLTHTEDDHYTFVMPAADVHVHWIVDKAQYTITINPSVHGTVTADNLTAQYGEQVTLTPTPDDHYILDNLSVAYTNGHPVTVSDNKFTMPAANVAVTATFKPQTYTITVEHAEHGSITAPATAGYETPVEITVTPDVGYQLGSIKIVYNQGTDEMTINPSLTETGTYTFTMPAADVRVVAAFEPNAYNIYIASTEHGTVTAPATALFGSQVNVIVTPDMGYEIDELYYTYPAGGTGVADPKFGIDNGSFTMPATNVTIVATFKPLVFNIVTLVTPSDEAGSIDVAASAAFGSDVEVTATPAQGYTLKELYYTYDAGGSVHDPIFDIEGGKFTMPGTDITVVAVFELEQPSKYNVAMSTDIANGTVEADKSTAAEGETVTLTVTPASDYRLASITVTYDDGTPAEHESGNAPRRKGRARQQSRRHALHIPDAGWRRHRQCHIRLRCGYRHLRHQCHCRRTGALLRHARPLHRHLARWCPQRHLRHQRRTQGHKVSRKQDLSAS